MVKIVTYWSTLMYYASQMGKAERAGNDDAYEYWKRKHDSYRDMCLQADEMVLPGSKGDL
jgi:hypothetical protein